MSRDDDISLVQACRSGQTEAYGELIERYQHRLYPMLVRLVGSPEDAQDLLQDAFVRGFEKLDQYQGESSFYTWIYRITVNLAMNRLRKRQFRRVLRLLDPRSHRGVAEPADESPTCVPSYAAESAEREALVEAALVALDPDHRAVVVLKDFEGRRYEEIGELLGIPTGTVRSRLHRARQQLRVRLQPLVDDERAARTARTDVERIIN